MIATNRIKVISTSRRRSIRGGGNQDKDKMISTRIGKVILARRIDDCNKYSQSDIDKYKIQGE